MAASAYFETIQKMYIAYFGRPADPIGLEFWANKVDAAAGNTDAVINGFAASTESQALFGNKTSAEKINAIYTYLFNRPAEPAGLNYWVQKLDNGEISQAGAMYTILTNAGAGDIDAINNKVAVAKAFTAALDTNAEILGYSGAAAADVARNYLQTVNSTAASKDAALAAVDTTITNVVNAQQGATGQTFTLTTGQDNPSATSGNDTIIGLNGTGATLTLGDVINGGAGTDTLKVTSDNATVNLAVATISNVENVEVNNKAVAVPGVAGTSSAAGTLNLNSVAYEKAVFEGVTGDEAATATSDTLTVNNANLATRVVLKDITDVASTVNFVGATGAADTATVEVAKATESGGAGANSNNNLTVGNIETLNLVFSTGANAMNVVSAAQAKTVNLTVESGANTTLSGAAALAATTALNINATGNLTLSATADLANDAVITVSGSGDVNLNTLEGGKTVTGDSVNAAALTGKLTVVGSATTASITGGSGADTITSAANTTVVVAGDGNDYVSIGAVDYGAAGAKTVAGGSGRDTLNITASANLDAGLMANVTGFEVLDIKGSNGTDGAGAGNGNYNVDGRGFAEVTIGGALTKAATVSGITSELLTISASTGFGITYALKTATGDADALKVTIAGAYSDAGTPAVKTDDANDLVVAAITTADIETVTIESKTDAGNVAGVKNTLTQLATNATKLVVSGDHVLEITNFDNELGAARNTTIKTIDASASKGLIMSEGVQTTTAVSITGSAYGDTLVIDALSVGANTINAGKGGDVITLGANNVRDTLILNAGDSQIGFTDTNKDGAYTAAADAEAFDVITGFVSGTDLIDLGAFGFTGQKQSALANKTLAAADIVKLINGTTTSIADFFVDTGVTRGVAVVQGVDASTFGGGAGSTVVFIDANGNGTLDAASDMMVVLTGTATVALSDFGF